MNQHIGSIIDSALIIGVGVFALIAPQCFVKKEGRTPEQIGKRILIIRVCGGIMAVSRIISLLLQ